MLHIQYTGRSLGFGFGDVGSACGLGPLGLGRDICMAHAVQLATTIDFGSLSVSLMSRVQWLSSEGVNLMSSDCPVTVQWMCRNKQITGNYRYLFFFAIATATRRVESRSTHYKLTKLWAALAIHSRRWLPKQVLGTLPELLLGHVTINIILLTCHCRNLIPHKPLGFLQLTWLESQSQAQNLFHDNHPAGLQHTTGKGEGFPQTIQLSHQSLFCHGYVNLRCGQQIEDSLCFQYLLEFHISYNQGALVTRLTRLSCNINICMTPVRINAAAIHGATVKHYDLGPALCSYSYW